MLVTSKNEKINKKITAFISNFTLSNEMQISFFNRNENSYFKINSNNIKIKKSGKIRISANLNVQHSSNCNNAITIKLVKNDVTVLRNYSHCGSMRMYYYDSCVVSDFELDVTENDIIELYFVSEQPVTVHNDEWGKSYLSLEMI